MRPSPEKWAITGLAEERLRWNVAVLGHVFERVNATFNTLDLNDRAASVDALHKLVPQVLDELNARFNRSGQVRFHRLLLLKWELSVEAFMEAMGHDVSDEGETLH
jgi:hypothetical protein